MPVLLWQLSSLFIRSWTGCCFCFHVDVQYMNVRWLCRHSGFLNSYICKDVLCFNVIVLCIRLTYCTVYWKWMGEILLCPTVLTASNKVKKSPVWQINGVETKGVAPGQSLYARRRTPRRSNQQQHTCKENIQPWRNQLHKTTYICLYSP